MRLLTRIRLGCLLAGLFLPGLLAQPAAGQSVAATRQYATAVRLQNLESYDLAGEAWAKFLEDFKDDPRAPTATHYLGVCYFHDDQLDRASSTLQKVIAGHPQLEVLDATYLYLGVTQYGLAEKGQAAMYVAAAKTFGALIAKFPEGRFVPDALFYRGECFYALGKKQEAVAAYSRLVGNHPRHRVVPDGLYALGVAQEELGQFPQAGKTYALFLTEFAQHPLSTEVGMRRGETLFAVGQFEQAAGRFAAAAASDGFELADFATVRRADALAQQKQYAAAAAIYASVPEKFPTSGHLARAALAGGKCHYLAGDYASARGLLETLLDSGGDAAAEGAHWIAKSLLKEDRPEEALRVLERVLPPAEGSAWAAQLLMDQADAAYEVPRRREESIGLYAALAAEFPQDPIAPQALYMAGFAALELGRHETARKHSQAFLAARPTHELAADVMHVAAESELLTGALAEAEKLYGQLLRQYPARSDSELWRVRLGLSLKLQEKYKETIAALEPVVAKIRDRDLLAEAQYLIGSSRLEMNAPKAAVASLEASLAAQPAWRRADQAQAALARAYRECEEWEKAKATLRKLIAESPESDVLDQAHYRLGEIGYLEEDYDTAAAEYRRVISGWPQSPLAPHALHELGCTELNRKDPAAAEKPLTELVEKYPRHKLIPQARYARAMCRHQQEKFSQAIEDLRAMLAADPSSPERSDACYLLGLCQMGLEQFEEAAGTLGTLLTETPEYTGADNAQYQLAWSLKLAGDEEEAVDAFARLARKYSDSPRASEAHYHVAESAYRNQDYQRAASSYLDAMKKSGKSELNEKAGHKLAWSYYHQGDFAKAERTFYYQQSAYPDGPLAADAAFMQAECLFKQEKFTEALAAYEKRKRSSNEAFEALGLLHAAQSAGQLEQWQESLQLATECSRRFGDSPQAPEALYAQGWARQKLGQQDEASALYEEVIAATGREVAARAQFMIGEIQFDKKLHAEAVKSFFKVLYGYSYPTWQAEAAYEAGRCFEVLGKITQAVKLYQELAEKFPQADKTPLAKKRIEALQSPSEVLP